MDPYKHRRSRPLHQYRLGWSHYRKHRRGERHGHRRRSPRTPLDEQRTPTDSIRHAKRLVRGGKPVEIARQVLLGTLLAIGVAFITLAVWGFITIWQARDDLRGAQSEATALAQDRTQLFTSKGRSHAADQIVAMNQGAASAASLVNNSIPLQALSWIPFVGQQVTGVKSLVNDFDTTSKQAGVLLGSLRQLIGDTHFTSISLPDLTRLDGHVHAAALALAPLDRGSGLLIGPLASARDNFDKEITKVTALLSTGGSLLNYALPFLGADGPRTYLVAGENNAEMRDQGAVLSWAILKANDGTFTMTKSHSVGTLKIRHPARIRLPAGTLAAFGQLEPTQVWQSVNATADFPLSGEVMAAMYRQRTHLSVDGVIGVDPITLKHMLEATGGVKVKGIPGRVTSHNVLYTLMHRLYVLFPKGYEQNLRHDEVAAVASAAVSRMKHHRYDLAYLVDQLAKAAKGRHLLVWSKYPVLERAVANFGASGSLVAQGSDTIHLAVESAVAAKLDWYVHTSASYHVSIDSHGTALITATIVIKNDAPKNCRPHYVCGPDHINSHVRGQYVARLDQWFPRGAATPGQVFESGLTLARLPVNVLPGQQKTYLLDAVILNAVHKGAYELRFIPQSTLNPQHLAVSFSAPNWSASGPSTVSWVGRGTTAYHWSLSH